MTADESQQSKFMAETGAPRNEIIRKAILQQPDAMVSVTIALWERLASELVAIIGQGGFDSLYSRSLHVAGATFPWLCERHPPKGAASPFAALKTGLEAREFAEAGEASIALLITFIDILASLIGESLTNSLLRSAWGNDVLVTAVKDTRS